MAASTARACRRNEVEETHSVSRFQASWRETSTGMAITVAEDAIPAVSPRALRRSVQRPGQSAQLRASLRKDMEKFVIDGGAPLSGTIVPAGNKNGALPILAACLLTEDQVILRNVPRIRDVEAMVLLIETLGAGVRWLGPSEVAIDASSVDRPEVDRELAERIRASFLLAGPLLARFGRA